MAPTLTRTLIAAVAIAASLLAPLRTGATSAEPAPWQAGLDVQLDVLEDRGTTLVAVATELRAHLGLPPATLVAAERCNIAAAERTHGVTGALPARPEEALATLISELEEHGPDIVRASLALLRDRGGRVRWSPQRVDELGALALQTRQDLHVGTDWLIAGLADASAVHGTIAHEVEGHLRYGDYLSCRLLATALIDEDPVDEAALFHELAYAESEIYAELKELAAHTESNAGDAPEKDVHRQVERIRSAWPPALAEIVIGAMNARFDADETLSTHALAVFAAAVDA